MAMTHVVLFRRSGGCAVESSCPRTAA